MRVSSLAPVSSHAGAGPERAARSFKSQTPNRHRQGIRETARPDLDATEHHRAVPSILHQGNMGAWESTGGSAALCIDTPPVL